MCLYKKLKLGNKNWKSYKVANMNAIEIHNQSIEIVFENCECIYIDVWAIKNMFFDVCGEHYAFCRQDKKLMKSIDLNKFELEVSLENPKHFYHTNRLKQNGSTVEEDGKECIERLKNSDDITHIYINGVCYSISWYYSDEQDSLLHNKRQQNKIIKDKNDSTNLYINIDKGRY